MSGTYRELTSSERKAFAQAYIKRLYERMAQQLLILSKDDEYVYEKDPLDRVNFINKAANELAQITEQLKFALEIKSLSDPDEFKDKFLLYGSRARNRDWVECLYKSSTTQKPSESKKGKLWILRRYGFQGNKEVVVFETTYSTPDEALQNFLLQIA